MPRCVGARPLRGGRQPGPARGYHETTEELRAEYADRPRVPWAEAMAESAGLVFPVERTRGAITDPDDDMVLECALAAEADFIVSGDKRHLLPLKKFRGIPILSPAAFLSRLPDTE